MYLLVHSCTLYFQPSRDVFKMVTSYYCIHQQEHKAVNQIQSMSFIDHTADNSVSDLICGL